MFLLKYRVIINCSTLFSLQSDNITFITSNILVRIRTFVTDDISWFYDFWQFFAVDSVLLLLALACFVSYPRKENVMKYICTLMILLIHLVFAILQKSIENVLKLLLFQYLFSISVHLST